MSKNKAAPLTAAQLQRIRSLPGNDACADSGNPLPDWCSVTYGTLLSLESAGHHRGLGVHLSFVRSLTMDDFTEEQFQSLVRGGNGRWKAHCDTMEDAALRSRLQARHFDLRRRIHHLYNSDHARVYREDLSRKVKSGDETGPVAATASRSSSPRSERVVALENEPVPSYAEVYNGQSYPFVLHMTCASKKSRLLLFAWGIFGLYGALRIFSRDGDGTRRRVLAAASLVLTCGLPYAALRRRAAATARAWIAHRLDAYKSARNLLRERIASGRARRLARGDAYYPPWHKGEKHAKAGLIFYPGALVDRTAYAPIACRLSDAGVLVCVANLEPQHRIIADMTRYPLKEEAMRVLSDALLLGDGTWTVDAWALGGHSMGAHVAIAAVATELHATVKKLVLWGSASYPPESYCLSPRTLRDAGGIQCLVLNGSEDTFSRRATRDAPSRETYAAKMPPPFEEGGPAAAVQQEAYTRIVTIEGGNHAGCAHYGPQTYPLVDGTRKITLEEQQSRMTQLTAKFLLEES